MKTYRAYSCSQFLARTSGRMDLKRLYVGILVQKCHFAFTPLTHSSLQRYISFNADKILQHWSPLYVQLRLLSTLLTVLSREH